MDGNYGYDDQERVRFLRERVLPELIAGPRAGLDWVVRECKAMDARVSLKDGSQAIQVPARTLRQDWLVQQHELTHVADLPNMERLPKDKHARRFFKMLCEVAVEAISLHRNGIDIRQARDHLDWSSYPLPESDDMTGWAQLWLQFTFSAEQSEHPGVKAIYQRACDVLGQDRVDWLVQARDAVIQDACDPYARGSGVRQRWADWLGKCFPRHQDTPPPPQPPGPGGSKGEPGESESEGGEGTETEHGESEDTDESEDRGGKGEDEGNQGDDKDGKQPSAPKDQDGDEESSEETDDDGDDDASGADDTDEATGDDSGAGADDGDDGDGAESGDDSSATGDPGDTGDAGDSDGSGDGSTTGDAGDDTVETTTEDDDDWATPSEQVGERPGAGRLRFTMEQEQAAREAAEQLQRAIDNAWNPDAEHGVWIVDGAKIDVHRHTATRAARRLPGRGGVRAAPDGHRLAFARRLYQDGRVLARSGRQGGGILVDGSGSMAWDQSKVDAALAIMPGLWVGWYSLHQAAYATSKERFTGGLPPMDRADAYTWLRRNAPYWARLCVIAEKGRVAEYKPSLESDYHSGGNEVDGDCLKYFARICQGPRVWVSDGQVYGAPGHAQECARVMRQYNIVRVLTVDDAVAYLSGKAVQGYRDCSRRAVRLVR